MAREKQRFKFWPIVCVTLVVVLTFLLIRANQRHWIANSDDQRVEFDRPLETKADALVCPSDLLLEHQEGHDAVQMFKVARQMFGRDRAAAKLGCEVWREERPVELGPDQLAAVMQLQHNGRCGLVLLNTGRGPVPDKIVLNCELQNRPGS